MSASDDKEKPMQPPTSARMMMDVAVSMVATSPFGWRALSKLMGLFLSAIFVA